tara:strand:- start:376 stop:849 length:474 start_codon:yes stop_codon:yes gene_type:complete
MGAMKKFGMNVSEALGREGEIDPLTTAVVQAILNAIERGDLQNQNQFIQEIGQERERAVAMESEVQARLVLHGAEMAGASEAELADIEGELGIRGVRSKPFIDGDDFPQRAFVDGDDFPEENDEDELFDTKQGFEEAKRSGEVAQCGDFGRDFNRDF